MYTGHAIARVESGPVLLGCQSDLSMNTLTPIHGPETSRRFARLRTIRDPFAIESHHFSNRESLTIDGERQRYI